MVERVSLIKNIGDLLKKPLAQEVNESQCKTWGLMYQGDWL